MNAQDLFTATDVGTADHHTAVETSRTQQRRIEDVRPVSGGHQDDAFVRFETVHLDQQLVQGLLALIVSATETSATVTSDGVDFVDEDNARRILLTLLEQVTYPACAHAYEHLDEVRTRDREERNVRFAGHRSGQQGLAGSRRSDEQNALGNAAAELLELLRFAQKFDDLAQFFLGFIHAGHVLERDFLLLHGEQARPALAERKRFVTAGLHLADHEEPQGSQQDERRQIQQPGWPPAAADVPDRNVYALLAKGLDHVRVVGWNRSVEAGIVVAILAAHFHADDGDLFYVPLVHIGHEL